MPGASSPRLMSGAALVAGVALFGWAPNVASGQERQVRKVVYAAAVDAIIHPVTAEYMVGVIDQAEAEDASLVVFTLRTPGGLVDSTRTIVSRMIASKVPIAVYVAPSGARAASAGFIVLLAADLAVMAPGTHIGAATPVAGSGQKMDETSARKAAADLAAYVRTLAAKRHRNVTLAEEAVSKSRAFTEEEALGASPPLIDYVATDLKGLLSQASGRNVTRFDGTSTVVDTLNAAIVPVEMTWRQRVLSAIANPDVAYLLLSLGTLGLTIELWSPGAILPGVVGGLCLLLAFFAFQVLPINFAGLLLICFGIGLLLLEVKVASFGLLTVGGLAGLVLGALMLIDSPAPELQVSLRVIVPVTIGLSAVMLFLVRLAVQSQRRPVITGVDGMIDQAGQALSAIVPGGIGQVATRGEIWQARAVEPIATGDSVRVVEVNGLVLTVRKTPS